ncbi:glycerophosphodiester phosphodiesterase [Actinopolyspora erythraea]|uniref:Glycerophosphodiester phosphodiesterase n=1 Tax=Actinopolyspora erythraea TaxID=414996 RepID=A0A099D3P0_9ACTN|nr:glycerophosphodiester phosphodiesterase family protein [Actinopolyspora erythraea]ASU81108.1 glycerophosphodiester phosphodiesterase [Actinopolyspora erythraea]KGI80808.1 glycerophosphodiester phosphodiesterase [Actinopolyspora erythraea]
MFGSFTPVSRRHPFLRPELHPRAFAHRGWHIDELAGMENSLSAFRRAVREGFQYLETDVHATSDGVAVVHHDSDLRRTTDSVGEIRRHRWSAVAAARIGGREPVCSLDQLLEELPEALLNIDVKADSAVVATLRTIRRHDAWHRVCLAGFSDRRLGVLRTHGDPRLLTSMGPLEIGRLWSGSRPGAALLTATVRGGALPRGVAAQVPRQHRGLRVVDRRFVERAHAKSTEVHVWTVDEPTEMAELLDTGVDGLLTDRPDLLRGLLRQRGQWPTVR